MPSGPARDTLTISSRLSLGTQYGVRLEDEVVQFAIATPTTDGRYRIEFEDVAAPEGRRFLTEDNPEALAKVLADWADRHHPGDTPVAFSLDGDFCVTRVTIESVDSIDKHLEMLRTRVHRYLQLGPGPKAVGEFRSAPADGMVYAATGVVNQELIQRVYDAIDRAKLTLAWVEPSLISLARLAGKDPQWYEKPTLIADGTGSRWDLGIASQGRLQLDYRPAAATDLQGMQVALKGHFPRLQRFCMRRRGIMGNKFEDILVCGSDHAVESVIPLLDQFEGIDVHRFELPNINDLFENSLSPESLPAVATVLPRLEALTLEDIADLTAEIRRVRRKTSTLTRLIHATAPAITASLLLISSLAWMAWESSTLRQDKANALSVQEDLKVNRIRARKLAVSANLHSGFQQVDRLTPDIDWNDMIRNLSGCLPPNARLRSVAMAADSGVQLVGEVGDDSTLYDVIGAMRGIPDVATVALRGTEPITDQSGSRFTVSLDLKSFRKPDSIEGEEY